MFVDPKVDKFKLLYNTGVREYNDFVKYIKVYFIIDDEIIDNNKEIIEKLHKCYLSKCFGTCKDIMVKLTKEKEREINKIINDFRF